MNPKFIGIGAQKAGTTWLHARLGSHPQIWMPYQKELHYFDEKLPTPRMGLRARLKGQRPVDVRWRTQVGNWSKNRQSWSAGEMWWWAKYFTTRTYDDAWYQRLFTPAGDRVSGDISPRYALVDRDTIAHIHRLLPDARIIYFVRHPVERAWSHAVMQLRLGEQAVSDEELYRHFDSPGSRERSDYDATLDRWLEFFEPRQVFLGFFEDIVLRPSALLDEVCRFLDVDPLGGDDDVSGRAVHRGRSSAIPAGHARRLAEMYVPQTEVLADRFGAYADWWRFSTAALAELDDAADDVPYPFVQTDLFEAWLTANGHPGTLPALASGTLDRVLAAAA